MDPSGDSPGRRGDGPGAEALAAWLERNAVDSLPAGELERKLDPRHFVRIHRCAIINIECLKEFRPLPHGDYLVKLVDGKELTMSRNYRQKFRQALSALSYTQ